MANQSSNLFSVFRNNYGQSAINTVLANLATEMENISADKVNFKTDSKEDSKIIEYKNHTSKVNPNNPTSTDNFLKSIKDYALTQLGWKIGNDGKRDGILSGIADYFSDTAIGQYFGMTSSKTVSKADAGIKHTQTEGSSEIGVNLVAAGQGIVNFVQSWGNIGLKEGVLNGAATGASIGSIIPGLGTVIGGVIGGIFGGICSLFHRSGKSKDQKERDVMRKGLQQMGIIDDKFTIGLADGSRYDIGIDGKAKAEFGNRKPFEIDPSNQLAQQSFEVFTKLASQICGGNENLTKSLAGYLTNGALSNTNGDEQKVVTNIEYIMSQFTNKMGAATS